MPIVSQEEVIQEELIAIYELIVNKRELVKAELTFLRSDFDRVCNNTTIDEINSDSICVSSRENIQVKIIEYDFYCHVIDILDDFKDINDKFPEYYEMFKTLDQMMLQLAKNEKYEQAAILKQWVDKMLTTILKS